MSFETGSIGCRIFYVPGGLPHNAVELFAKHAAPPIESLGTTEIHGWVTGRHLLDRVINEDSAHAAGRLRLTLMKAERKIPSALLHAERRIEELSEMQAEGLRYLKRERKMEIKERIIDRLLPTMPPSLTGIDMVYDSQEQLIYASAMSIKQLDAFCISMKQTTTRDAIPITAATAAVKMRDFKPELFKPTSFSPELEDPFAGDFIGQDFLTWLWFFSEARGGTLNFDGNPYGVLIEGPLTFVLQGDGAHTTVLRDGAPEVSTEAKTCLLGGKKLKSARVTMGGDHEAWSFALDADDFVFRGLKLAEPEEKVDSISRFEQRMLSLERFRQIFFHFYETFLAERLNGDKWASVQKDIHKWVTERKAKR